MFDHLGVRSTLRPEPQKKFPRCYEELTVPVVFPVEAFNARKCPRQDFTPCGNLASPPLELGAMRLVLQDLAFLF